MTKQLILIKSYSRGLKVKREMKKDIINDIKTKEIQLAKLKEHVDKSSVCSELYNKVVLEKAVLRKELQDMKRSRILDEIKSFLPRKKKLICDYFAK